MEREEIVALWGRDRAQVDFKTTVRVRPRQVRPGALTLARLQTCSLIRSLGRGGAILKVFSPPSRLILREHWLIVALALPALRV